MTSHVNMPRQLPIDWLVEAFQACLLALIPQMEAVEVAWRDGEAYDDWDRIGEALFKSVVSTPVGFTPSEGASRPLRRYKYDNAPAACSMLFDEELGEAYEFFGLKQTSAPFDTARFQPEKGEDVLKPVTECRFRVRLRSSLSADTRASQPILEPLSRYYCNSSGQRRLISRPLRPVVQELVDGAGPGQHVQIRSIPTELAAVSRWPKRTASRSLGRIRDHDPTDRTITIKRNQ